MSRKTLVKSTAAVLITLAAFCVLSSALPLPALAVDTGLDATAGSAGFKTTTDPQGAIGTVIAKFINQVLAFVGVIFLVLMIYAGFTWMTAAGNEEKISKAKKLIVGAIIGTVIVFGAYAITNFLVANLESSTGIKDTGTTAPAGN